MISKYFNENRGLISFTFFNLIDKAFVFLLPFAVLTLFHAKAEYVQLEYIISTVNIFATFSDLGVNGYMFYLYQRTQEKSIAITISRFTSERIFLLLLLVSILIVFFHTYLATIDVLIYYILTRVLFHYITTFFTSYFRLLDEPIKAVYVSLIVNVTSLLFLLIAYQSGVTFSLWLIFVPQAGLVLFYLLKIVIEFKPNALSLKKSANTIIDSLKFSWPSIIQVFLMVYMANYGKINALDKLSTQEAVFLGYTLRFCMIIQLAHASLVGFYAKSILSGEDQYSMSNKILKLYAGVLLLCYGFVVAALVIQQTYFSVEPGRYMLVILFSLYTLFWCFYSYLEMYYARINRNRIKLYLTFAILMVFIGILNLLPFDLLYNIAFAMFCSIFIGLILNIIILKKLKFRLS